MSFADRYGAESGARGGDQARWARPVPAARRSTDDLVDIDFSSLVTYFECGYLYWLRHVCGFQPPLATEFGFGKLL